MNLKKIETFWQKFWETNGTFNVVEDTSKEKYFLLDMFLYYQQPIYT